MGKDEYPAEWQKSPSHPPPLLLDVLPPSCSQHSPAAGSGSHGGVHGGTGCVEPDEDEHELLDELPPPLELDELELDELELELDVLLLLLDELELGLLLLDELELGLLLLEELELSLLLLDELELGLLLLDELELGLLLLEELELGLLLLDELELGIPPPEDELP